MLPGSLSLGLQGALPFCVIGLEWGAGYRCTGEVTRGMCGVAALCVEIVLARHPKDSTASGP